MADGIIVNLRVQSTKGNFTADRRVSALSVSMTGTGVDERVSSIGFAAHEQIAVNTDIGTKGWAFFRNLDATNFVEIGLDIAATFYPLIKLKAGEAAAFRLSNVDIYAQADTGAVDLLSHILED